MDKPLALVIEDDETVWTVFERALQASGYVVQSCQTGKIALQKLATLTPSLIILDLHLPDMSGEDILQVIRAEVRLKEAKVVLASADAALANWLDTKVDFVLNKPISYAQLKTLSAQLHPQAND